MPIYGRTAQGTYNMPSGGYFLCELEWMARTEPRPKIYNSFVVPHLFIMLVWWWWWWWWRFPPYLRIHRGRPERGHIITYDDDGLDRVVDRHNANELNTIAQAEEKTTTNAKWNDVEYDSYAPSLLKICWWALDGSSQWYQEEEEDDEEVGDYFDGNGNIKLIIIIIRQSLSSRGHHRHGLLYVSL